MRTGTYNRDDRKEADDLIRNRNLLDRFLRYVQIDTQSDEDAADQPTTAKQRDLAELLLRELDRLGAQTDYDREHCYLYASLAARGSRFESMPPLGLIGHLDTSPAVSGSGVKPRILENFRGGDAILKEEEFPDLAEHYGEDLIASDGTTLLGADDKAGVAEIMNLVQYFHDHPEESRRAVRIAFTPDEETGRGTEHFDAGRFGAKEAYTVDGGKFGVIEYECFNAAAARVELSGRNVHPGRAKNQMKNACRIAVEFASMLPPAETPEHTEGYEGFYHLDRMEGNVEKTVLWYIIRDHDRKRFEERKDLVRAAAAFLNGKYGAGTVNAEIHDQYYNMADVMKDHMDLVDRVKQVLADMGESAVTSPIRGGTDGAVLSFRGIPCPNLCTGGYNYHSRFEYASVQEMEKTAEMLIRLVRLP
jgi:tripeptide aminopeptidase